MTKQSSIEKQSNALQIALENIERHYREGLITAKGLVYFYIHLTTAPDTQFSIETADLARTLGLQKAEVITALEALNSDGRLEVTSISGLSLLAIHFNPNKERES